jgi:hypothetical protein
MDTKLYKQLCTIEPLSALFFLQRHALSKHNYLGVYFVKLYI